jgi:hypothetical protein
MDPERALDALAIELWSFWDIPSWSIVFQVSKDHDTSRSLEQKRIDKGPSDALLRALGRGRFLVFEYEVFLTYQNMKRHSFLHLIPSDDCGCQRLCVDLCAVGLFFFYVYRRPVCERECECVSGLYFGTIYNINASRPRVSIQIPIGF